LRKTTRSNVISFLDLLHLAKLDNRFINAATKKGLRIVITLISQKIISLVLAPSVHTRTLSVFIIISVAYHSVGLEYSAQRSASVVVHSCALKKEMPLFVSLWWVFPKAHSCIKWLFSEGKQ